MLVCSLATLVALHLPSLKRPIFEYINSTLSTKNLITLTNEAREAEGMSPLTSSRKLNKAARKKAQDMITNQYFAHTSPTGTTPWYFFEDVAYPYLFAAENIAINYTSAEDVMDGWLASPSHRENIMSELYTETGLGFATGKLNGESATIIVQLFGTQIPKKLSNRILGQ